MKMKTECEDESFQQIVFNKHCIFCAELHVLEHSLRGARSSVRHEGSTNTDCLWELMQLLRS